MRLISNLKRAGYLALAITMAASAMAALPKDKASATCEGPEDLGQLQVLLDERNNNQNITLCGDIEGQFTVYRRMTTINLNGHTISSGTDAFARVREQGRITITGTGTINGRLSGGFTQDSFIVQGGTWTADVTNFVSSPYAAYVVDGLYVVEPEITEDNFVVSPTESSEGLFIHVGKTGKIDVTLPEGSTSGVTFTPDEEDIVEISADGTVTGLSADWTKVTVSPTYDPTITKEVLVTVYEVAPTTAGDEGEIGAAENVRDLIDKALSEMETGESEALVALLTEAFGEDEAEETIANLWEAVYYGDTINTKVNVAAADLTDDEKAEIAALMSGVNKDNITYYDVTVDMNVDDYRLGGLRVLGKPIRILLAEVSDPAAGYIRQYYMVSYHDGEPVLLKEGVDFEIVDGKIYLISDRFSVFALGYKDVLSPNTGFMTEANAAESTSANTSSSVTVVLTAVALATILATIGAIAKRK